MAQPGKKIISIRLFRNIPRMLYIPEHVPPNTVDIHLHIYHLKYEADVGV